MKSDLQKYAERKMPLFNLVVSIWQHNLALKNTIGIGFENSVSTFSQGTCDLVASKKEMSDIAERVVALARKGEPNFAVWYEQAKQLNKEADQLLAEYTDGTHALDIETYAKAKQIFTDNFGFCTILPYWVLYGIEQVLEAGAKKEDFTEVLRMYEELKSETRYPQLAQVVIGKYFAKAAEVLGVSQSLASCLHPDELGRVIAGENPVTAGELQKRFEWCALTRTKSPLGVTFSYDKSAWGDLVQVDAPTRTNSTEIKGSVAYRGLVRGRAKIVNTIEDMQKFEEGDILISIQSSPSLMPALIKCGAIVTDEGGIMCHASVISRELKKPCIIGTKVATKVLKDGDMVEVDAERGTVRII